MGCQRGLRILCEKNHIEVPLRKNKRKFAVDFQNYFAAETTATNS